MDHIAIDLGSRESQLCIRNEKNEIVLERRVSTRSLGGILRKRPSGRVVIETSAEAFAVADVAKSCGHEVRVVPATLVRALGVGARGLKTDQRDARVLSDMSTRMDLPSVHVPSQESRELKALCTAREALICSRTKLINTVRGFLRTKTITLRAGRGETFVARVRKALGTETDTASASADPSEPATAPGKGTPTTKQPSVPSTLPEFAVALLDAIDALSTQISALDKRLEAFAMSNPICARLMTTPGVGPVCSARFVAAIDDTNRFADASKLQSYLGLVPGEQQSGMSQRRTGLIKRGQPQLRRVLVQSAWCLYRTKKSEPMVQWAIGIEQRRGKKIAIAALARKLATVMFALWRDGAEYTPGGVTRAPSESAMN